MNAESRTRERAEANAAFHFIATKAEMNGGKATADILTVLLITGIESHFISFKEIEVV